MTQPDPIRGRAALPISYGVEQSQRGGDIMTDQDQPEKDEKELGMDEKADEKTHEKQEEKSWEEKRRRDPLGSIAWAVILIWAGVVFLASNMNLLETLGRWSSPGLG